MERYRGHFFNWYETTTRKALRPLYVSTVDSGNLAGHVRVLSSGLLELPQRPLLPESVHEGLSDTLNELTNHVPPGESLESVRRLVQNSFRIPLLPKRPG